MSSTAREPLHIGSRELSRGSWFVREHHAGLNLGRAGAPPAAILVELDTGGPDAYSRVQMDENGVDGLTIARLRQAAQLLLAVADELEHDLWP